jgi:AcrR family transcriptional regulator
MTKAENTRQMIIERSAVLFNEKGFAGTSFSDLVAATGLSKGCIYGNFENKDEIAVAVFDFNAKRIADYLESKVLQTENSIERLLVYPKTLRNFTAIPIWDGGCPILNTSIEADDTHPLLKESASKALFAWQKIIENEIVRGIERKEIKSDTNPGEMAIVMTLMIEGALMQAKVSGKMNALRTAMSFLENLILTSKQ